MLESLLRAKLNFFSRTRAGSIIQRFAVDLVSCKAWRMRLLDTVQDDILECSELLGGIGQTSLDSTSVPHCPLSLLRN